MAWQLFIQSLSLLCHPSSYDQRVPLPTPNTLNNHAVQGLPVSALISNRVWKKKGLTVSFPYMQLFLHFKQPFCRSTFTDKGRLLRDANVASVKATGETEVKKGLLGGSHPLDFSVIKNAIPPSLTDNPFPGSHERALSPTPFPSGNGFLLFFSPATSNSTADRGCLRI